MKYLLTLLINFLFLLTSLQAQNIHPGAGNSYYYDGSSNHVNVGDQVLNNCRTVELWFKFDQAVSPSTTQGQCLIGRDYNNGTTTRLNEFALIFPPFQPRGSLMFQRMIGTQDNIIYSNHRNWEANVWYHVAAVVDPIDGMKLFINGIQQQQTNTSTAPIPVQSGSTTDATSIGRWGQFTNGTIRYFQGEIDEVRLWTSARSEAEIRANMCHTLQGNEAGLRAYWNFDEAAGTTIKDKTSNGFDGIANGMNASSNHLLSYAPLGDISAYLYNNQPGFSNWNMASLGLVGKGGDSLLVSGISPNANPDGVHIYYIDSLPNLSQGISNCTQQSHFGVFIANDNDTAFVYDATYYYGQNNGFISSKNETSAALFHRKHHADSSWANGMAFLDTVANSLHMNGESYRNEYILSADLLVDLGPDLALCEGSSVVLRPAQQGNGYIWQDGSMADSLLVTQGGMYWVAINRGVGCMGRDSVRVTSQLFPNANYTHSQMGNQVQFNSTYPIGPTVTYKWFFGDGDSSLRGNPLHIYGMPGTYNVMHIVTNSCGADTTVKKVNFAGSDAIDLSLLTELQIYPNPTSNWVYISGTRLRSWKLFDLQGRLLKAADWQGNESSYEINLQDLAAGIYFLELNDGKRQAVARIFRQ